MTRARALWVLGVLGFVLTVVLVGLELRMQQAGGWGGVDLQLSGGEERARDILADWGPPGRDAARQALWLDLAYLIVYGAFWTLAVAVVRDLGRHRGWRRYAGAARIVIGLPVAAAALDAVEDILLLLFLGGRGGDATLVAASASAIGKFAALAVMLAYVGIGVARLIRERWRMAFRLGVAAAIVLLAGLVVNAFMVSAKTEAADASAPGRILRLDGGDLHVVDEGPRSDSALILIPGYTGSVAWWDRVARLLSRRRRVIRVDLLGHGASEKPGTGYAMDEQARRVLRAARQLGVRRAVVVGHSLGGSVAVAAGEEDPKLIRGVAVIGTAPDDRFWEGPGALRWVFAPVVGQAVYRLIPDWIAEDTLEHLAFAGNERIPRRWVQDNRRVTYTAFVRSGFGNGAFARARPLDERVRRSGRPLLVVFGTRDRAVNPRAALDWRGPGATVVQMRGVGHTPQHERPAQTARLLLLFTSRGLAHRGASAR